MLDAKENATYTYVFAGVASALIPVTLIIAGNSMVIKKGPEKIVSETAHIALILTATQARNSFIDFIIV
jgi:hypothetical protein